MRTCDVLIAYPSLNSVHARFMQACLKLQATISRNPQGKGFSIRNHAFSNFRGSILPWLREQILDQGKDNDFTHILMVDSDMDFPPWLLHRWLEIDRPVIAANCCTKAIPSHPTARNRSEENPAGQVVFTTKDKAEKGMVEEVWRVGTGVMLLRTDIVKELSHPYFPINWHPELNHYIGEDWGFCEQLEAKGIPILIDHKASWDIAHIGDTDYTHEVVAGQMIINAQRIRAGLEPLKGISSRNGREVKRVT